MVKRVHYHVHSTVFGQYFTHTTLNLWKSCPSPINTMMLFIFSLFFFFPLFFSLFYYSSFFNHIPQITKPTAHQLFLFLPVYLTGCGINLPWRVPRKQGCTNVGNTSCWFEEDTDLRWARCGRCVCDSVHRCVRLCLSTSPSNLADTLPTVALMQTLCSTALTLNSWRGQLFFTQNLISKHKLECVVMGRSFFSEIIYRYGGHSCSWAWLSCAV